MSRKGPVSSQKTRHDLLLMLVGLICMLFMSGCDQPTDSPSVNPPMDQMIPTHDMEPVSPDRELPDHGMDLQFEPQPPQLKRLTNRQYRHAIHDFFGLELPADTALGTDTQLHGFRNIASAVLSISETEAEGYEASAQWVANQLVVGRVSETAMMDCSISDASCVESLIDRLGGLLWRRALTDSELALFMDTWSQLGAQPFSTDYRPTSITLFSIRCGTRRSRPTQSWHTTTHIP
jgi:hypothetical protein